MKVKCPDCLGDGKQTCHNPDHGFYLMTSFHDIGRIGCPCCGNDEKHKVPNGGNCETCSGAGEVEESDEIEFCEYNKYDYQSVMKAIAQQKANMKRSGEDES